MKAFDRYMERNQGRSGNSFSARRQPAVLRRLSTFADRHPLPGSALQGLLWGAFMFVVFAAFSHGPLAVTAIIWASGGPFFGLCMYPIHRWRWRRADPTPTMTPPL
jgi:hypothetical protein